jgi:hypothetical protein
MHEMAMEGMANDSMQVDGDDMQGMVMDDESLPAHHSASNEEALLTAADESVGANTLELPIDACTHCLSHSGTKNAPVSSVCAQDQSSKEVGPAPWPMSRFFARPSVTLALIGLPREHGPPGKRAPRYILLNVFLI